MRGFGKAVNLGIPNTCMHVNDVAKLFMTRRLMIQRLVESHDLRKFANASALKKTLSEIFQKEEFLEILDDKQLLIGLKNKDGSEALHVEDENLLDFLRLVRDNLHPWNDLIKIKRSAHRQLQLQISKSVLHDFLKSSFDQYVFKDSLKISKRLHDFDEKMQYLHDRLQGVFLLSGIKKDVVNSFDSKNSVIVYKMNETRLPADLCWVKEARYSTVVIFCNEDINIHKYLKNSEFEKLTVDKKKCKNIWVKNYK
jgi:hypothetical protein